MESHLSNPSPHPLHTNQRKLLQLSSAFPNDPAFLPAAGVAPCSQPSLASRLSPIVFLISGASPKIIKLQEDPSDYADSAKGKSPATNSTLVPVKGINNLGNTCFFNAVMQNLSQTHMLIDLIQEVKEKGFKLRISPTGETNVGPLTVMLPSPEPLTAAMFLFLQSMKDPGKGPVNPKILFNQLCQK
ncbi:Ubiquitin carboxyl-terminal hydrolase 45 [Dissostichus eleginoides]|nr:Ubiquitin carboxyl-terminal hydrolase 45 [Dissostichus eleginoides]